MNDTDLGVRSAYRKKQLLAELTTAIKLFNGAMHGGEDSDGIVDVEFPSMLKAASFVEATHLEDDAVVRGPEVKREFNCPVTIQFSLIAYAMCR